MWRVDVFKGGVRHGKAQSGLRRERTVIDLLQCDD